MGTSSLACLIVFLNLTLDLANAHGAQVFPGDDARLKAFAVSVLHAPFDEAEDSPRSKHLGVVFAYAQGKASRDGAWQEFEPVAAFHLVFEESDWLTRFTGIDPPSYMMLKKSSLFARGSKQYRLDSKGLVYEKVARGALFSSKWQPLMNKKVAVIPLPEIADESVRLGLEKFEALIEEQKVYIPCDSNVFMDRGFKCGSLIFYLLDLSGTLEFNDSGWRSEASESPLALRLVLERRFTQYRFAKAQHPEIFYSQSAASRKKFMLRMRAYGLPLPNFGGASSEKPFFFSHQ